MGKKYLAIIGHSFLEALEYRAETLSWVFLSIIPTLILLFVWSSIYQGVSKIHGISVQQMLQYFLLQTLINGMTATHFEEWRAREIRTGKIDVFLIKPLPYPLYILLRDLGGKTLYISFLLPLFGVIYFLLSRILPIATFHLRPVMLAEFLCLLVGGYLIEFGLAMISVTLTFWFEGAEGLQHFKWIIVTLFSGSMIPIPFMPDWLKKIVMQLPFQYMYAVPIQIMQQTRRLYFSDIIFLGLSLLVLYCGIFMLWKKAMYKYTSAGG